MLLLLLHGAKHGWSRLKWLVDVARFVPLAEIDYECLLRSAESRGYRRALLIGMDLAARLLSSPLPECVAAECRKDRRIETMSVRIARQMARREPLSDGTLLRFRVQSRERTMNKLRVLGRTIFSPNQADFQNACDVPESRYYFSRPLRLLRKRLIHISAPRWDSRASPFAPESNRLPWR